MLKLEMETRFLVTFSERSIDPNTYRRASWHVALRGQRRRSIATLKLDRTYLNLVPDDPANTRRWCFHLFGIYWVACTGGP